MTNAIQKFCIARSVKLHAEQEESKHRDEVFRVMQSKKKPVVVRADGRIFLVSLDREKYLSVVEVEDPSTPDPLAGLIRGIDLRQAAAPVVEIPITEQKRAPTDPVEPPASVRRIVCSCSKTFAKAMTVAANDEGWTRSQWSDAVIPEAYLAWVEDGALCDDPASGDSQVVVTLSAEVFAQVEDVGKAIGGRSVGAALRRLIAYSLPNGGTP